MKCIQADDTVSKPRGNIPRSLITTLYLLDLTSFLPLLSLLTVVVHDRINYFFLLNCHSTCIPRWHIERRKGLSPSYDFNFGRKRKRWKWRAGKVSVTQHTKSSTFPCRYCALCVRKAPWILTCHESLSNLEKEMKLEDVSGNADACFDTLVERKARFSAVPSISAFFLSFFSSLFVSFFCFCLRAGYAENGSDVALSRFPFCHWLPQLLSYRVWISPARFANVRFWLSLLPASASAASCLSRTSFLAPVLKPSGRHVSHTTTLFELHLLVVLLRNFEFSVSPAFSIKMWPRTIK